MGRMFVEAANYQIKNDVIRKVCDSTIVFFFGGGGGGCKST